jgi:hypothetical protein
VPSFSADKKSLVVSLPLRDRQNVTTMASERQLSGGLSSILKWSLVNDPAFYLADWGNSISLASSNVNKQKLGVVLFWFVVCSKEFVKAEHL